MTKKFTKGFTLIELLVVIAIIGILSSIVLASLNTARGKGSDAAVKSAMDSMRAQAELVYDSNGQVYNATAPNDVCGNATVVTALANMASNSGATGGAAGTNVAEGDNLHVACDESANAWMIQSPLKGAGGYWCVDSVSDENAVSAPATASQTACAAS